MTGNVIDREVLNRLIERIGGDPDDLQMLVDEFEKIVPDMISSMNDALAAQDWPTLQIAAHSMKSNARDLGALELSTLCAELEKQSAQGEPQDAQSQISMITTKVQQAVAALKNLQH